MSEINLTPEIYQRFKEYHEREPVWGYLFHVQLDDYNLELDVPKDEFYNNASVKDRELADIFNKLSYSQRKKIANRC